MQRPYFFSGDSLHRCMMQAFAFLAFVVAESCSDENCFASDTEQTAMLQAEVRLSEPRDEWDYRAYDKSGPKEGHPFYNSGWSKPPGELAQDTKIRRSSADEKKSFEKESSLWPAENGYRCDLSSETFETEEKKPIYCQLRAIINNFDTFAYRSGFRCVLIKDCKPIPASDWSVYSNPATYPVHSRGQLCERKKVPAVKEDWEQIDQFYYVDVPTRAACQAEAERKEYKYWAARKTTFYSCEASKTCSSMKTRTGYKTYEFDENVNTKSRNNQTAVWTPRYPLKATDKVCSTEKSEKVRYVTIKDKPLGMCFIAPVRCYWSRELACQNEWNYYSESPMREYFECYVFPTCDAPTPAEGWEVHRRPTQLWPAATACSLHSPAAWPLSSNTPAAAAEVCQDRATRLGHKYYQVTDSGQGAACTTANECSAARGANTVYVEAEETPTRVTCTAEAKIKSVLAKKLDEYSFYTSAESSGALVHTWKKRSRANILRAVFHDAQDFNRLMLQDNVTGEWARMEVNAIGDYGGVDGCLYEPIARALSGMDVSGKKATSDELGAEYLNFNLRRKAMNRDPQRVDRPDYEFAVQTCKTLCCGIDSPLSQDEKDGLCGSNACDVALPGKFMERCMVDIMVLGVNLIVKDAGGPDMRMTWGRHQRDCRNIFKRAKVPESKRMERIGFFEGGLRLNSMHLVVEDFRLMGFDPKEMAALMGAHTFGRLHKYTGSYTIRNTVRGFCNDPKQTDPPLVQDDNGNWMSGSDVQLWELEDQASGACKGCQLHPRAEWGMGGVWDHTPDAFDNQYFQMLDAEDINEANNCCGPYMPKEQGGCYKKGDPQQTTEYKNVSGCDVNWCARDYKSVVNTKQYHRDMRIWRLAADWAILEDPVAREEVRRFAEDESAFHEAFAKAWGKIVAMGHPTTGSMALKTCTL
eukprot:TRINITY_DN17012_c0_g1_i1.p1 TRINITY_DN17012_c0_g1~~TRINITY_DN17012_c0_g1_i1.p1  ORF type:complete len:924 (-),score=131.31 TRINITY_DN17012_c0_g1_i1:140-2911(-)